MFLSLRVISAGILGLSCLVTAAACYYKSRRTEVNEVMTFCKLQLNVFNYFDKLMSFVEGAKKCVNICMPGLHNPAIQGRLVELLKKKSLLKIRILIDESGYNAWSAVFLEELKSVGKGSKGMYLHLVDSVTNEVDEVKLGHPNNLSKFEVSNPPKHLSIGAEIQWKCTKQHKMKHKFCLVDDCVLMTGTLDWGNDLSCDNWNYVLITSKSQLVQPVKHEFYRLWDSSDNGIL